MWGTAMRPNYKVSRLLSKQPNWLDGYADYDGKIIKDADVANLVVKHLSFFDKFNPRKIAVAGIYAQLILFGVIKTPKGNWKFFDKHFEEAYGK